MLLAWTVEEAMELALQARPTDWLSVIKLTQRHGSRAARVSIEPNGYTALHLAAMQDRAEYASLLCARGAIVDSRDDDGFTPLHHCGLGRYRNFPQTARVLLHAGADVHAVDSDGETALHIACCFGHLALAKVLVIDGGADVNSRNLETGQTPLHWSCVFANKPVAQLLILSGADIHAETNSGETALYMANWRGHDEFYTWLRSIEGTNG